MPRRKKLTPYAPCEKPPGGGWNKPSATLPRTDAHVKYPISERFYLKTRLPAPVRACLRLSAPVAPVRGPARNGETKPQTCPADHKKKRQPGTAAKPQGSIEEAWVTQERSKKQESTNRVRAECGQRPDRGQTGGARCCGPDKIGGRAAGCYSPSPGCPEATRTHSGHRVPPVPGLKARMATAWQKTIPCGPPKKRLITPAKQFRSAMPRLLPCAAAHGRPDVAGPCATSTEADLR